MKTVYVVQNTEDNKYWCPKKKEWVDNIDDVFMFLGMKLVNEEISGFDEGAYVLITIIVKD